jgi:hypothetical protein
VVFAEPGPPDRSPAGTLPSALLPVLSAILLVVAGGLAIGGSFGKLEEETERAGDQNLTLTYTSWRLKQGGNFTDTIYFHAPHFGIPLVAAGALTVLGGLLLMLGRGRLGTLARPIAVTSAGLLVGTVWTVGLVVSADLDAVTRNQDFELDWTSGIGFWLLVGAGGAAALGGVVALLMNVTPRVTREEPPTPRYGFPVIQGMQGYPEMPPGTQSSPAMQPVPRPRTAAGQQGPAGQQGVPEQQIDPLGGHPIGPPTPQPFPPPTPPSPGPVNPA